MFDGSRDGGSAARLRRARALLDRVLSVDSAQASGAELSGLMVAGAELAAIVDGAAVAAVGPLSHLVLLTRARRPEVAEVFDRDEAVLVAEAQDRTADSLSAWLRAWRYGALEELGVNDPDRRPDHDSEESTAKIVTGFAGRGLITVDVTPVALAIVSEAVDARIETWRRTGQLSEDDRSYQELVAAALLDLIADGSVSSRRGQLRPLLIVTAQLTDLFDRAQIPADRRTAWSARIAGGGPVGHAALHELIEQANIHLVVTDDDGEPLAVGRAKRFATAAMLVALITRAGGTCEFPGCHAKHHRANAHHIRWWRDGGSTDLDNLTSCQPALSPGGLTLRSGQSSAARPRYLEDSPRAASSCEAGPVWLGHTSARDT